MMNNPEIFSFNDFRQFLLEVFHLKHRKQKKYSLRMFSKELGLRPTAISDILSERKGMSTSLAQKIASQLSLNLAESQYFISLVEIRHGRSLSVRKNAEKRIRALRKVDGLHEELSDHQVDFFEHWYHPAILELISLNEGNLTNDEIQEIFSLSEFEVDMALKKLIDLGFLERKEGRYIRNLEFVSLDSLTPRKTVREFHKQLLSLAQEKIETNPIEKRKFISNVFSFKSNLIQEARNELDLFHDQFIEKYADIDSPDSVYAFSMQLFRLDKQL